MKVTAAVIEEEGRVLIARRKPGRHMGGKWEFPGGKIEPGETPQESLARELREELAIQARVGDFLCSALYEGDGVCLELLVYRVERVSGEPALIEHQDIRWVRPEELAVFDLADSDRRVAEVLYG
ncbi:MAG TPA: (deoxy)nucleoside triphosphate pyrophosphohydrolase [Spirochaetia bacterium]|nr:(deoxy)nucleoside triphosphate pyrophosphohydrolase [Spirochaetia bacterium]